MHSTETSSERTAKTALDDGPYSSYDNTHWKRVSNRNTKNAGYVVEDEVDENVIEDKRKHRRHSLRQNQSVQRRGSRSERGSISKERTAEESEDNDFPRVPHVRHASITEEDLQYPKRISENQSLQNPFNKYNHKVYSVLSSPCFMFLCIVCCYPGVHFMRKSDKVFNDGNVTLAKAYSRRATILLFLGLGIYVLLMLLILFFVLYFVIFKKHTN